MLFVSFRDRAPFVFTSDMAYVINGGDKPSSRFHDFVDLCCEAYNLIRKHAHLFLNLLGLVSWKSDHLCSFVCTWLAQIVTLILKLFTFF